METTFNKQETIKLLEEYYLKLEGKKVKVNITAKTGCFGLYETQGCETTVTVAEEMDIAGIKKEVKTPLSKDEVRKNLKALFALYEFDLKGLDYEDGLSSHCEGYGMDEHTVHRAYFNGVTVKLEKLTTKTLGKHI